MLNLPPDQIAIIRAILADHVPGRQVMVFGSRVNGKQTKPYSDLDLCIMGEEKLSLVTYANLKEAFSESDLPIKIDVVDWAATTPEFQNIIAAQAIQFPGE